MRRINFFQDNKAWYKARGIPYTMGFLFYGEPGCGKTSTIKAIANHTQRHIVAIPLNKIKTGKELLNVFYNVKMNYKDIPLNQRLYVLEDIDCADLKNIVTDRSKVGVYIFFKNYSPHPFLRINFIPMMLGKINKQYFWG